VYAVSQCQSQRFPVQTSSLQYLLQFKKQEFNKTHIGQLAQVNKIHKVQLQGELVSVD